MKEEKWVYLHSGAQAMEGSDNDKWFLTGRPSLAQLPGMEAAITTCFKEAEATPDQVKYLDLYSCFPCVVELAADVLGMKHDDPRGFTITGGLPFYGQFSSTGCVPHIADKLRKDKTAFGLVTNNGGYAQKHSASLFSATPPKKPFALPDLERIQAEVDAKPGHTVNPQPEGKATVESFTVHHNQNNQPTRGVIVGLLDKTGERFLANTDEDPAIFKRMMDDCLGAKGTVTPGGPGKPNRFVFDA